ncbi:unnamed protein product, partial [Amoebophrya sp. A120]
IQSPGSWSGTRGAGSGRAFSGEAEGASAPRALSSCHLFDDHRRRLSIFRARLGRACAAQP